MINDFDSLKQHETAIIEAQGGYKGKYNSNGGDGRIRVEFMDEKAQKLMDKEKERLKASTVCYDDYNFVPLAWVRSDTWLGDIKLAESK